MKKKDIQKQIIKQISTNQKIFDKNLKNKTLMFIYEKLNRSIGKEEMFFPASTFYHLTGIKAYDINNKLMNSYKFYDLLQKGRIDRMKLESKNSTTFYKLEVLSQLTKIDRNAKMIGDFCGSNILLQTEKVAGNINACIGFVKDSKQSIYVPNTALKEDIRNITQNRGKIIAILKKEKAEQLYKIVTYLNHNYQLRDILKNEVIKNSIDIENLYSLDSITQDKIKKYIEESN